MTPDVKPPGSQLPVFWEIDVICFANLLSVFYGNSCETESLTHQIDAIDTRFICAHGISVTMSRPLVGELHSESEWIDIQFMVTYYRICERYLQMKGEA